MFERIKSDLFGVHFGIGSERNEMARRGRFRLPVKSYGYRRSDTFFGCNVGYIKDDCTDRLYSGGPECKSHGELLRSRIMTDIISLLPRLIRTKKLQLILQGTSTFRLLQNTIP